MTPTQTRTPAEDSSLLGGVALALGIVTLLISLAVASDVLLPAFGLGRLQLVGIATGIAAVAVSIVAIVTRRGRRRAVVGLILAIAGPVLAWGILLIVYVIQFSLYEPAG